MVPGPGRRVPSTALIRPAESMPWAMRSPNAVVAANSAFRCTGLVSVLTAVNIRMSASVIVLPVLAVMPVCRSSKKVPLVMRAGPVAVRALSRPQAIRRPVASRARSAAGCGGPGGGLQDEPAQVALRGQRGHPFTDIGGIHRHRLSTAVAGVE